MNLRELLAQRAEAIDKLRAMVEESEGEKRDFTDKEKKEYKKRMAESNNLQTRIERIQALPPPPAEPGPSNHRTAPNQNRLPLGDTEAAAVMQYVRSGDGGGLKELRASNDTDMNITTDADGGYSVPTGHHQKVIARRDEASIISKMGVLPIPGKGTTVNVPIDNEADGEFVETAEGSDHDRDAPALTTKALTLLRYTKKIQLSWELLEDEDSKLMAFIENFVGRGMAKTHNSLLLTEVAANGTSLKTFASATVIAIDELEPVTYNDAIEPYLDDGGAVGWVMRRSVHGEITLLDDANVRRYANNQMGGPGPSLLGSPIVYSYKSGATAASAKSVYFGNWNYVGYRDGGISNFLRDPYSYEAGIELRYQYRVVYGVLQAEAIGYGVHPSA